MNIKVTVGIPVYNAGKYIEKCVLSVLEQTMEEIELLIIDDHGTDDSMKIVRQLADTHIRGHIIRIVDNGGNRGVAHARNSILHEAKGKYIFFLDQDDYVFPNALQLLYEKAEAMQAEVVWGSYYAEVEATGERIPHEEHIYENIELIGADKLALYDCRDLKQNLQLSVWNILFRADFFRSNNLLFEPYGHYDDVIMQAKLRPLVTRAVLMNDITYIWYMHEGSGSNFQYREHINVKEGIDAMDGIRAILDHCKTLSDKTYYDVWCAKVMKQAFFVFCGVLKHRGQMNEKIGNHQLKEWMQHPATLRQILSFKQYKKENLAFWCIGMLPAFLMVSFVSFIGKKKGFI